MITPTCVCGHRRRHHYLLWEGNVVVRQPCEHENCRCSDFTERKKTSDPRNNPDDAYAAFMSMGESEWQACLRSILGGGVFQPAEQAGFERALKERRKP
jgi:hypothetical protein